MPRDEDIEKGLKEFDEACREAEARRRARREAGREMLVHFEGRDIPITEFFRRMREAAE
jgi:hypothetical protein